MNDLVLDIAEALGRDAAVVRVTAAMLAALLIGSGIRLGRYAAGRREGAANRLRSLRTWWIVALILVAVVAIGRPGLVGLLLAVSALGLYEYLTRLCPMPLPRPLAVTAYALLAMQYACIAFGPLELGLMIVPTLGVVIVLAVTMASVRVDDYLKTAGPMVLGVLLLVYLPSFALMLPAAAPVADPLAPALALLLVTMTHDIAAALVGRAVGGPHVLPTISPRKTWAGLAGGFAAAAALGAVLAPLLLGLSWSAGVGAGLAVAAGAFVGDATFSALKRGRGLKDSGRLLPGQGGMIDRIDSLTTAAPLLFLILHLSW